MSLSDLLLQQQKPWLNAEVNDLIVDGNFTTNISNTGSPLSLRFYGPFPDKVIILTLTKFGPIVNISIPTLVSFGNNVQSTILSDPIPLQYRPQRLLKFIIQSSSFNGSVQQPCLCTLDTTGVITIYSDVGGSFYGPTANSIGFQGNQTFSYSLN